MANLALARKVLALAVCLALPTSGFSAELARSGAAVEVLAPAAPQFHQELNLRLSALMPVGMPLDAAITPASLRGLASQIAPSAAQAQSPALAQANAFVARILLMSPEAAQAELARAHVPADQAARLIEASRAMQVRVLTDPEVRAAYLKLANPQKAAEPGVMAKARALAAKLESSFKPETVPALAGGPADGGPLNFIEGSLGERTAMAASAPGLKAFVPVAKKVSELLRLAKSDREAAFALASALVNDPAETRVEVRASALRVLATYPAARSAPVFVKAAADPSNWYIQRLAVQLLGKNAAELGENKNAAVAALKEAFKSSNPSVRLMAQWSLAQLGVDAGPETAPRIVKIIMMPARGQRIQPRAPRGDDAPRPQQVKSGPSFFRIMMIGLAFFLMFRMFTATPQQTKPDAAPTQIEQTVAAPKLPEATTPEQKVMNQMATDMHQMAETAKRAQAHAEKVEAERAAKEEAEKGSAWMGTLFTIALAILPIFLMVWLFKRMQGGAAGQIAKNMSGGKMNIEKPTTRFSDVAGVDDAKMQIQQVADYIRNPLRYMRLGAKPPKGILLEGPPGTGKTLLARALAGESEANFISMKGSDFIEMFVGVGAGRVRELFETARRAAPTIVFIDEIDAIGKARGAANVGSGGSSEHEQTLISLIAELDGFIGMENVIVVAATNRADVLDPALLRPGRFDRKIYVGNPDVLGREAILAVHGAQYRLGPDVDLEFTARRTAGLAGAGMANILNEGATQGAVEDHDAVTMDDVQRGVDKETFGERRNLFIDDATKERVAYHEAGHALAGMLANEAGGKAPNKITIIPHGSAALGYAEPAAEGEADTYLLTKDQLFARIVGAMGGRAAEEVIYGKDNPDKGISTGPGSDIEDHADRVARMMVEKLGMSDKVGIIDAGRDKNSPLGGYKVGEKTREMVDDEVRKITAAALQKAKDLLLANVDKLEAVVKVLKERETIFQQEIEDIVRPSARTKGPS